MPSGNTNRSNSRSNSLSRRNSLSGYSVQAIPPRGSYTPQQTSLYDLRGTCTVGAFSSFIGKSPVVHGNNSLPCDSVFWVNLARDFNAALQQGSSGFTVGHFRDFPRAPFVGYWATETQEIVQWLFEVNASIPNPQHRPFTVTLNTWTQKYEVSKLV
ncbi:hypothetical protein P389DRAFT_187995 [Cystobasidium minutum MCA 4210]|uniref:uncharacterized protein n=1 Tax=Cystobasidium minutum MCA 4210 TaxID=1397322 RepID=UPI0034CDD067|eukprot:jgi/Rhomi1/187995/estExt_fgenesh1_pg.C_2_t10270